MLTDMTWSVVTFVFQQLSVKLTWTQKAECLLCETNQLICPCLDQPQTLYLTVFNVATRSSPAYALPRMYIKRYLLIGLELYFLLEC